MFSPLSQFWPLSLQLRHRHRQLSKDATLQLARLGRGVDGELLVPAEGS